MSTNLALTLPNGPDAAGADRRGRGERLALPEFISLNTKIRNAFF